MARIRHDAKQLETMYCTSMLNEVVWIDETFFKIAKKSWALILVINVKGEIVGWKLSRTRKESDISDAIRMADTAMPNFQYIIGDGCIAYPKAMIARKKDVHLIQQMHTHPWRAVRISKFEFLPDTSVTQTIVEID